MWGCNDNEGEGEEARIIISKQLFPIFSCTCEVKVG